MVPPRNKKKLERKSEEPLTGIWEEKKHHEAGRATLFLTPAAYL